MSRRASWRPVLLAAGAALVVALLGGLATDTGPWYQGLAKPAWQPPDWLFAPVWTVIYALTAAAAVLAWRHAPDRKSRTWIVALFLLNAALNVLWTVVFFRFQRPDIALLEVVLLWLSVLMLILLLYRVRPMASALLVPYLIWVAFAAALNLRVVQLNGPFAMG